MKINADARGTLSESADYSFLDIVATVLSLSEVKLDLIPDEIRIQRSIEEQGRQVIVSGILGIMIMILVCAIFFVKIYFKSTLLENLKKENAPKRKEAELLENVTARTGLVKDYFKRRLGSLDVINELFNLIPEEIYLENVTLDAEGKIAIQGISESMSQVFSLVGTLEDSALFKGVKTTSTTAKKERGKDVAAFEITFRLESAKDEEDPSKDGKDEKDKKKDETKDAKPVKEEAKDKK